MAVLLDLRDELGTRRRITGAHDVVARLYELYDAAGTPAGARSPPRPESALEQIGRAVAGFGDGAERRARLPREPARRGARDAAPSGEHELARRRADHGARRRRRRADRRAHQLPGRLRDGVPVRVQLKQFGANIYVADLVGLSVTRELGPLMTAIIVCGPLRRGVRRRARHDEGLRGDRRAPHDGLRRRAASSSSRASSRSSLVVPLLTLLGDLVGILGGAGRGDAAASTSRSPATCSETAGRSTCGTSSRA